MINDNVRGALKDFFRATAEAGFKLPIRFKLHNSAGALLREFKIHRDGLELSEAPARPEYNFPLLAEARSADGRIARMRLTEAGTGTAEFVN